MDLLLGFLLHRTPARLMRAVRDATPAVWGVILQFPFYAGIAGASYGPANAVLADDADASDCASLVERRGGRVAVVLGDPALAKVTERADLERVEALLGA